MPTPPIHALLFADDLAQLRRALAMATPEAVNARDEFQRTALHYAAQARALEAAAILVDAGADFRLRDVQGHTPLDLLFCPGYDPLDDIDPAIWGPN